MRVQRAPFCMCLCIACDICNAPDVPVPMYVCARRFDSDFAGTRVFVARERVLLCVYIFISIDGFLSFLHSR